MRKYIVILIGCLIMLCVQGCLADKPVEDASGEESEPDKEVIVPEEPEDYFPLLLGTTWKYNIEVGDGEPVIFFAARMEYTGKILTVRELSPINLDEGNDPYKLEISVLSSVTPDLPVEYSECFKLEIVRDDLEIFDVSPIAYLAVLPGDGFNVCLFKRQIHIESHPFEYGTSYDFYHGFSQQHLFFDKDRISTLSIRVNGDVTESLEFIESEESLSHFRRVVEPFFQTDDNMSEGFTEDTWFEKGVGLTRLVQKVDGEISMVWELTEFTPGED